MSNQNLPRYWHLRSRFSKTLRQMGSSSTARILIPIGNWSTSPFAPPKLALLSSTVMASLKTNDPQEKNGTKWKGSEKENPTISNAIKANKWKGQWWRINVWPNKQNWNSTLFSSSSSSSPPSCGYLFLPNFLAHKTRKASIFYAKMSNGGMNISALFPFYVILLQTAAFGFLSPLFLWKKSPSKALYYWRPFEKVMILCISSARLPPLRPIFLDINVWKCTHQETF